MLLETIKEETRIPSKPVLHTHPPNHDHSAAQLESSTSVDDTNTSESGYSHSSKLFNSLKTTEGSSLKPSTPRSAAKARLSSRLSMSPSSRKRLNFVPLKIRLPIIKEKEISPAIDQSPEREDATLPALQRYPTIESDKGRQKNELLLEDYDLSDSDDGLDVFKLSQSQSVATYGGGIYSNHYQSTERRDGESSTMNHSDGLNAGDFMNVDVAMKNKHALNHVFDDWVSEKAIHKADSLSVFKDSAEQVIYLNIPCIIDFI